MRNPTRVVGNSAQVTSRVISTVPCKLYSVIGFNNSGATEYVQVHQTSSLPSNGAVPIFSFSVNDQQYFSFDIGIVGVDLDAVTVAASTTLSTLTIAGATFTFQGIIAI